MIPGAPGMGLLAFWRRAWAIRESLVLTPEVLQLLALRHAEAVARLFVRSEKEGLARENPDRLRVDAALAVTDPSRPGPRTADAGATRAAMTRALCVILDDASLLDQLRPDLRASLAPGGRPIPAAEWATALATLRSDKEHECALGALSPDPAEVLREVRGPLPVVRLILLLAILAAAVAHWAFSPRA